MFAPRYVSERLEGFEKDLRICLTGVPSTTRPGPTHAYLPALITCCATLELFGGLYRGKSLKALGINDIMPFTAAYLSHYDADAVRILYAMLRNRTVHLGIATGVWVEHAHGPARAAVGLAAVGWNCSARVLRRCLPRGARV